MIDKKILFGVQGTGNGHLNRARLMAEEFRQRNVSVDYLFSGRATNDYFDMELFDHPLYRRGLSFKTSNGRLSQLQTLLNVRPVRFLNDVRSLRTDRYDLILTDFEPTVAWAANFRHTRAIAIGHQYALTDPAPLPSGDYVARWLLKHLAPGHKSIGLHWYPYHSSILPPMIDTSLSPIDSCQIETANTKHAATNVTGQTMANRSQCFTLVYLPFEDLNSTIEILHQLKGEHFVLYSAHVPHQTQINNVSIYPLSNNGFKHHLQRCERIICNTGFELISEALYLGKPVLTKPLQGQFEQSANALALRQLGLATVTRNLSVLILDKFLSSSSQGPRINYPNVAGALVDYCLDNSPCSIEELAASLWSQVGMQQSSDDGLRQKAAA